jgi:DNA invertase Pin-like site-specific DNA recombinase
MKTYDALIRVSKMNGRKESAETTMTVDDQDQAIARAINEAKGRRGVTVDALDQSGFTIHRTDAYRRILERVRRGESHGVVVAYGDRLTRNWRGVGPFYDELEAAGAEVLIAGMPGVDYRTAAGRTMTGVMAVMSDAQYMTAKARGDAIADLTVKRGVPNAVPYGYRRNANALGEKTDPELDGKALVPDEQAAPIVRRIFRMRVDGYRWAAIIRALNDAGVPSPRGGQWVHATVATIVQNEVYTGVVKLGERRHEKAHEPLVSASDWKRAQTTRTVAHTGRYKGGIAGGLLECSSCGGPMVVTGGEKRLTYGCRRTSSAGPCPRPMYVSKDAADRFVIEEIDRALRDGRFAAARSSRKLAQINHGLQDAEEELHAYILKSSARDPLFEAGRDAREREVARWRDLRDQEAERADTVDELPSANCWRELVERNDLERMRRVARQLIAAVVVDPPASQTAPIGDRFREPGWRLPTA